jgi:hypothetical protein
LRLCPKEEDGGCESTNSGRGIRGIQQQRENRYNNLKCFTMKNREIALYGKIKGNVLKQ